MNTYGLIGKKLGHSFSKKYFTEKFEKEKIPNSKYELFELPSIEDFPALLKTFNLRGLNATIPYKQEVIPYLDEIDDMALEVGAVNVIKPIGGGQWKGYNSDCIGFKQSLLPLLKKPYPKALILGTGGASKAVAYVLKELGIEFRWVSRTASGDILSYEQVSDVIALECPLWINTTPLGMHPKVEGKPNMPYHTITAQHLLYDLVYNPLQTAFMKEALDRGANAKNGLEMLHGQAEAAWEIWGK